MLALVVSNLLYPVIAVGVAALLCVVIVLRHRRPKSVEANMRAFNKGLRALAPEANAARTSTSRNVPRPVDVPRVVHRLPTAPAAPPTVRVPDAARHANRIDGAEADTG